MILNRISEIPARLPPVCWLSGSLGRHHFESEQSADGVAVRLDGEADDGFDGVAGGVGRQHVRGDLILLIKERFRMSAEQFLGGERLIVEEDLELPLLGLLAPVFGDERRFFTGGEFHPISKLLALTVGFSVSRAGLGIPLGNEAGAIAGGAGHDEVDGTLYPSEIYSF